MRGRLGKNNSGAIPPCTYCGRLADRLCGLQDLELGQVLDVDVADGPAFAVNGEEVGNLELLEDFQCFHRQRLDRYGLAAAGHELAHGLAQKISATIQRAAPEI